MLRVAAYIYAADLAVKRNEREQHLRTITVEIPVVNFQAFERVRLLVEQALSTVSCDNWTLTFSPLTGRGATVAGTWPKKNGSTLLFSGGLDSFAGSLHLLQSQADLALVSHITHNRPVENSQTQLAAIVGTHIARPVIHVQIRIFGRNQGEFKFPADDEREETQRTRSFLFTSLAATAARLNGSRRIIVMAENGQFAIHLPLSEARVSSFSYPYSSPKISE